MFTASSYVFADEAQGWSISLPGPEDRHLILERPSPDYDEGEGLYFELDSQETACFGGLLEIAVTDKELIIVLTQKGARRTKLAPTFTIALDLPDDRKKQLVADLDKVCDGMCRVRRRP